MGGSGPPPFGAHGPTHIPGYHLAGGHFTANTPHPGHPVHPVHPGVPQPLTPLDSTYYMNVANHLFGTNNQINQLGLQGSLAGQALQSALAQMAYQQPRAQLALEQQANNRGGLYSSVYGQQLGNLNYQYMGQEGGAQQNYANTMRGIAAQIAAARGGEQLYDEGQYLAATTRATAQAAKDKSLGQRPAFPTGKLDLNPTKGNIGRAHHGGGGGGRSRGGGHGRGRGNPGRGEPGPGRPPFGSGGRVTGGSGGAGL